MTTLLFDCETNGLLDELDTIHSLVVKDADTGVVTSCVADPFEDAYHTVEEGLTLLAEADTIVGHNAIKFDVPALQKVYPDWKPRGYVMDTIVMARLLFPELRKNDAAAMKAKRYTIPGNMMGRYSLEAFGHRLGCWKGDYSAHMKALGLDPWAEWNKAMQDYCEQDIEVTHRLFTKLQVRAQGFSERSVKLEHDVATILARQERHGFLFNLAAAEKLYVDLVGTRAELFEELRTIFPPWEVLTPFTPKANNKTRGYVKGVETFKSKTVEFNPNSRFHIAERLGVVRGWKPTEYGDDGSATVDDAILAQLPWPEAQQIAKYLMVQKRIASLSEGKQALMKAIKSDGRIHGRVESNGAVTGRMTHSNPPMAGNPKVKVDDDKNVLMGAAGGYGYEFRSLFIVSKGRVLVGCDADALELRCLAGYLVPYDQGAYIETILRGDKKLGTDMHSVNARAIGLDPTATYPVDGKTLTGRDIAKTWFYAFLYGAGDGKLGAILGKGLSAGKASRAAFLKNLPALGELVDGIKTKLTGKLSNGIRVGEPRDYLVGLDGRRIFTRSPHSALNTLLQGAGAIIMKEALVLLDNGLIASGLSPARDYEFCANIHDEWQIEVADEHAETVGKAAADAIRSAGETLNFKCPLAGNYETGANWAETH